MSVVIETTIGDLTVDLFVEERPVSCLNFIKLCKLKYYNFNLFHTIEQGFIAQTGDPTGAGDGGSSIWGVMDGQEKRFYEAEMLPKIYHTNAGLLSLVSAGKQLVGSQFYFTLGPNLRSLDGVHCVIGEVVEGHETLRRLNEAIVDENFRPYQDIRITHTVVLHDPFSDPCNFPTLSRSPSPSAKRLQNGRIAADEDIDNTEGKSLEEIQEMLAEREAKARANILEIVGDLPSAEMAPPENVLFVCKLNPVTTDDDLEIIFNRFGRVKSCEVIRDKKSGDSLQYAFVEFEDRKACEAAYFKMDNVLIDDRRIHVDFSQSVAKVKWRGKGHGVEGDLRSADFDNLRGGGRSRAGGREGGWRNVSAERGPRMCSAERRKAREKRHKEQERSEKEDSRRHDDRRREIDERDKRRRRDEREGGRRRAESRERTRRDYRHRKDDISRRRDERSERQKSLDRDRKYEERERSRSIERKRYGIDRSVERERSRRNDDRHVKTKIKTKVKKQKRKRAQSTSSSSSSDVSSESEEETSSSVSESNSSDASADSKKQRKRHKKKRPKSQKKSKAKKSKKHKR